MYSDTKAMQAYSGRQMCEAATVHHKGNIITQYYNTQIDHNNDLQCNLDINIHMHLQYILRFVCTDSDGGGGGVNNK